MTALGERHRISRQLKRLDPDRPAGRKTAKTRAAATPTDQAPELSLVAVLPKNIIVAEGPHGYGVLVTSLGTVEVRLKTFNRDKVLQVAAEFLRSVVPKGMPPMSLACTMRSSSEPNWHARWWIAIVDGHAFATLSPIGPLIFPAPVK